jgi:hypothetical protein
MENIDNVLEFFKSVTLLTVTQLVSIFGILFIFGLILYFLASSTRRVYMKSVGSTLDIIVTGWIGTPVHEIGHALFCVIFFHKIHKIKLFDPNPKDGSIGYVIHSHNRKSIYQRIGNFFIGVGPIIFGSLVLYAAMYYLVPNIKSVFSEIEKHGYAINNTGPANWQLIYQSLVEAIKVTLRALSNPDNFSEWQFWLFIYISMSIASHMELSPPDIKGAFSGLITLVFFVFLLNLFVMFFEVIGLHKIFGSFWKYISIQTYMGSIARVTGVATALFIYATVISAINFLISWVLLSVYTLIRYRKGINPFWG